MKPTIADGAGSAASSSARAGAGPQQGEPEGAPLASRWLVLVVVLSAVFMQLLDTTITMVAIPSIQKDLSATFADIQLVIAVYSLAFACMLVTGGRLGDIYGRKRIFLIGMTGFTIASALCGAAPTANFLIVSRVVQGLFSGLMFPQVLSIIQVSFPERERPKALSFYGASIGMATVLGPVLGGWLIDLNIAGSDWRSIFYVNVPIGILALFLGSVKIAESSAPDASRLDLPGTATITTGLFLLILPLVIGREHDWPTWSLVMIAVSPLFLIWFALIERRRTARTNGSPLVPTTLFKDRSFSVGLLISLVFFAGIPSFFMTLFLTLQTGFSYSPVSAGAVTLAFAVMIAVASARSALVVRKLGTWTLALGTGLLLIGMGGVIWTLHETGSDLRGWQLMPALLVGGAGAGLFLAPCTGIILAGIKSGEAGSASGMLATTQQVGVALGIAIIGIIFAGLMGHNSQHSIDTALPRLRQQVAAAGLDRQQTDQVTQGFSTCFNDRMHQKDLTATPASCAAIQQHIKAAPIPAATKAKVAHAVLDQAVPKARKENFNRSFMQALMSWQLGVFALSCLLVLALPKVKPTNMIPGGA